MTIDTVFHDLSNETKAARISDNHGASNMYQYMKVCRSLKPTEKGYSQFKNEKIEKK